MMVKLKKLPEIVHTEVKLKKLPKIMHAEVKLKKLPKIIHVDVKLKKLPEIDSQTIYCHALMEDQHTEHAHETHMQVCFVSVFCECIL